MGCFTVIHRALELPQFPLCPLARCPTLLLAHLSPEEPDTKAEVKSEGHSGASQEP
jgi:hypothetical protein